MGCLTSLHTVRGKEFDVGIIDEGCFGNPRILKENMLPVWLMRGRVIIGISSPKGKNNYFAKLFFATYPDTKEPIFNTLVFTGACQKCTDNKKTDTCNHEPWRYPSYLQVNTKMEGIRLTMDQDVETFNREQKGIITDDAKGTYVPYKYIEKLKANAPFEWKGQPQPKFVVIGVDPNSGGSSDASFVALASVRGQVVVSFQYFFYFIGFVAL